MGLHRAHRQEQLVRDLGVGVAEGEKPQHAQFAVGELGRARHRLARRRRQARPQLGIQIRPSLGGGADRGLELGRVGRLDHVGRRARGQRLARESRVVLHGQHHDLGVG